MGLQTKALIVFAKLRNLVVLPQVNLAYLISIIGNVLIQEM